MGNHRRGKIQIVADMLEVGKNGGVKKTYFMYRCNLSYDQLERYMKIVLGANLLKKHDNLDGSDVYGTTEKGREFLGKKREIDIMLNSEDCPIPPYLPKKNSF